MKKTALSAFWKYLAGLIFEQTDQISHNAYEFVIDFGQYYPGTEEAELYSLVITSPCYAKSLLEILQDSINRYEKSFGTIREKK